MVILLSVKMSGLTASWLRLTRSAKELINAAEAKGLAMPMPPPLTTATRIQSSSRDLVDAGWAVQDKETIDVFPRKLRGYLIGCGR